LVGPTSAAVIHKANVGFGSKADAPFKSVMGGKQTEAVDLWKGWEKEVRRGYDGA
jgi:hypothetical protein